MRFSTPLVPGRLIRRYMRFLADVELEDGQIVKAHCPNPGSMLGLRQPGLRVWLEGNSDPRKKLDWGWRLVDLPSGLVGIDTSLANTIVAEALPNELEGVGAYQCVRREVKYGQSSRVDFLLTGPAQPDCYLEVKSVTLMRKAGLAEFPDSKTARGTKHLNELADMVRVGHRAVLLFLVQREDCKEFSVARDIDPAYAEAFDMAARVGVEVMCFGCSLSTIGIKMAGPLLLT